MTAFAIVPRPGIWRSGIHVNKTQMLIMKVASPMLQPVTLVTPSANTVHGLTPAPDAINNASPRPNKAIPKHKITNERNGGRMVSGVGALQNRVGIFLSERNASLPDIS